MGKTENNGHSPDTNKNSRNYNSKDNKERRANSPE